MTDDPDKEQYKHGPKCAYTDPLSGHLPELERCLIRHRAFQMILILFHAEELKRDIISNVAAQEEFRHITGNKPDEAVGSKKPLSEKKKQQHAFDMLERDGILTADERRRIICLIGHRNNIAHHLDRVTADLSTDRSIRNRLPNYLNAKLFDYQTLEQLRVFRQLLSERMTSKHYIREIGMETTLFNATERTLTADLKSLESRIGKLLNVRRNDIHMVNEQLDLEGTELIGPLHPSRPENRYGNGRLTPRGIETCYRLFDIGKSPMTVSHLMRLSLSATRRRQHLWTASGGAKRVRCNFADIADGPKC